jgi:hypothetical protein
MPGTTYRLPAIRTFPVRRPRPNVPSWLAFAARELALWGGLYIAYLAVRAVAIAGPEGAFANARRIVDLERVTGLYVEDAAQDLLAPLHGVLSVYYMVAFGPVVAATLVWMALRHRPAYRELSRALLLAIAAASVVFVLFPAAPPRLVPELGIVDTVGLSGGHDTGSFAGVRFNPYAAMPSMHVGWSLLVGLGIFGVARRRSVRILALAHPVVMTVTVVGTGNHYLLDAVAGAAIALAALAVVRWRLRPASGTQVAPARELEDLRVDAVRRPAAVEDRGHVGGGQRLQVEDGLVGVERHVWGRQQVRRGQQWMLRRQDLRIEDVAGRAADGAGLQGSREGVPIDDGAPGAVDEQRVLAHPL